MHGRLAVSFAAAAATALVALAAPAGARHQVESFDGTHITTHFYPAAGLNEGDTAPTILIGHGWGGTGEAADGSPAPFNRRATTSSPGTPAGSARPRAS